MMCAGAAFRNAIEPVKQVCHIFCINAPASIGDFQAYLAALCDDASGDANLTGYDLSQRLLNWRPTELVCLVESTQ